jgi:hypothetical protein
VDIQVGYLREKSARAARQLGRTSGQGDGRRSGGGDMADGEIFTDGTGQGAGLVVSTGILGDLVLPAGASVLHGWARWPKRGTVPAFRMSPSCRTKRMLLAATTFRGRSDA